MFDALGDRHRLAEQEPGPAHGLGVDVTVDDRPHRFSGVVGAGQRSGGRQEAHRHAGEGGVDARLERGIPEHEAEADVDRREPHPQLGQRPHGDEDR